MTAVLEPTAIDGFVRIEAVKVIGRHRKDLGDLTDLVASIDDVDLLNPITLTRDCRLVAGERRLEACRRLGWSEVPVRFVDSLDDAARLLRAELDENTCRKDMLPSELASLGEALYEIEECHAKERQREHGGTAPGRPANTSGPGAGSVPGSKENETRTQVGDALGMAGRTYSDLRYVYKAATDPELPEAERTLATAALEMMDLTGTIKPHANEFRRRQRAKRDAQEAKAAALADEPVADDVPPAQDENWIPATSDSSGKAATRRRELIRSLGASGYSSGQIAEKIHILPNTVRKIARDEGIPINADVALGTRTRKTIDSNRVVRETAIALEGLAMGVQLVNINDLDPAEIDGWSSSITASVRTLNRLVRQLKEKTQ